MASPASPSGPPAPAGRSHNRPSKRPAHRHRLRLGKRHPPPGSAPGTFAVSAEALPSRLRVIDYSPTTLSEHDLADLSQLTPISESTTVRWISVQGLGTEALLRQIGEQFGLHPLALADIVNTPQRPKVDAYDQHVLLIARAAAGENGERLATQQISIVLATNYVVTFEEHYSDLFEPVRNRIRHRALITRMGADFLAQAVLDAVIDGYYPLLERLGEHLEEIEEEVIRRPTRDTLHRIHTIKSELLVVRRALWPQRDAIQSILRGESALFTHATNVYFRDCYDHAAQVIDVLESYREIAAALLEVYLTSLSNRTNEVMKVLTVIATIFIPLTFIVGVYGMNFEYMPELKTPWAYPAVWAVMLAVAGAMLVYFYRRGWLDGDADGD